MKNTSGAYFELVNIINAAKWHKEHCHESCNVALYALGLTAKRLVNHCWLAERAEVKRMIAETEWT